MLGQSDRCIRGVSQPVLLRRTATTTASAAPRTPFIQDFAGGVGWKATFARLLAGLGGGGCQSLCRSEDTPLQLHGWAVSDRFIRGVSQSVLLRSTTAARASAAGDRYLVTVSWRPLFSYLVGRPVSQSDSPSVSQSVRQSTQPVSASDIQSDSQSDSTQSVSQSHIQSDSQSDRPSVSWSVS